MVNPEFQPQIQNSINFLPLCPKIGMATFFCTSPSFICNIAVTNVVTFSHFELYILLCTFWSDVARKAKSVNLLIPLPIWELSFSHWKSFISWEYDFTFSHWKAVHAILRNISFSFWKQNPVFFGGDRNYFEALIVMYWVLNQPCAGIAEKKENSLLS